MSSMTRLKIVVPATTANLGPGFDILGMSLNLYNEFRFEFPDLSEPACCLHDGSPVPFSKSEDLVWQSYSNYFQLFLKGEKVKPYECKMRLAIPLKSGLGSSATAVVAGFCLGREVHKVYYKNIKLPSEKEFLRALAKEEGHPDNTIPAYLGGWVLSYFIQEDNFYFLKKKFPKNISCFLFLPSLEISTNESRAKLPKQYSTEDVIFNMSRISTWVEFMSSKNYADLRLCVEDRIHTPQRIGQINSLSDFSNLAKSFQFAHTLSGSGPSLLVFVPKKLLNTVFQKFQTKLAETMKHNGISYQLLEVKPEEKGTKISSKILR